MKPLRVLASLFVVAVAGLGIWMASTGTRTGRADDQQDEAPAGAYDYEVRDVVVQQMGPDGALQYELSASQITQQPQNGRITATQLVMHRDPPGSAPDSPNRWTLRADRADLPESGDIITLQGKVRAEGRPRNSRELFSIATEQLSYNLESQDITIDQTLEYTWGASRFQCGRLRVNISRGSVVQSKCNGTIVP